MLKHSHYKASKSAGRMRHEIYGHRDSDEVYYCLSAQFLSGHRYFNACLAGMGKVEVATFQHHDSTKDNAHHTFSKCERLHGSTTRRSGPLNAGNYYRQKITTFVEEEEREPSHGRSQSRLTAVCHPEVMRPALPE